MFSAVVFLALLPTLVRSSGDGNIKLLAEEVAQALKACDITEISTSSKDTPRHKRFADYPRIDDADDSKQISNLYSHERRNASDMRDQIFIVNATDYDYEGDGAGDEGEKLVSSMPKAAHGVGYTSTNESGININRTRRSEPLVNKANNDQCLSQCVFANLQVVDSRGIPREAELWNKVQSSVTSQQSRAALRDQIGACFQELQSEAEDNGCSYSNKLERCLMLRFSDRKILSDKSDTNNQKAQT